MFLIIKGIKRCKETIVCMCTPEISLDCIDFIIRFTLFIEFVCVFWSIGLPILWNLLFRLFTNHLAMAVPTCLLRNSSHMVLFFGVTNYLM